MCLTNNQLHIASKENVKENSDMHLDVNKKAHVHTMLYQKLSLVNNITVKYEKYYKIMESNEIFLHKSIFCQNF